MTVRILIGDVRERLKDLPDESVHCVVTSPPYWGLRDYGMSGQMGVEPTLGEHIETMAQVFDEVWRVLRKDGTLWLNYGDSYATQINGRSAHDTKLKGNDDRTFRDKPFSTIGPIYDPAEGAKGGGFRGDNRNNSNAPPHGRICAGGYLKPKDLCGVPWRVAFALQESGWYLRQDIIWMKPNPMPESVKDRCTKAHEYIFLLTKSPRYYFDSEAISEEANRPEGAGNVTHKGKTAYEDGDARMRTKAGLTEIGARETRNKRSVWEIPTSPFPEAHFATFPPELPEICIRAGTSEKGCCGKCGKPWVRDVEEQRGPIASTFVPKHLQSKKTGLHQPGWRKEAQATAQTLGWASSCACNERVCENGCTVLDTEHGHKPIQNDKPQQIGRFADVPAVRDGVPRTERIEQVVLAGLSGAMGRQKPEIHNGQDDHEQGLCDASSPQSSDGGVIRVCDGAPLSDGSASRKIPETDRSGSPQERQSAGQQDREPRGDDEAGSRQRQKADVSRSVSALSQGVSGAGQCSRCGGRLVERPFETVPAVVLDIFGGAGTTGLVADRLQRNAILIELNPQYAAMAEKRIHGDAPLFSPMEAAE